MKNVFLIYFLRRESEITRYVPLFLLLNITVFSYVAPCSLVGIYQKEVLLTSSG
jgi:hypothetical protein